VNQLRQLTAQILQGMVSSKYMADFVRAGRESTKSNAIISDNEALALEAKEYARAIIKVTE